MAGARVQGPILIAAIFFCLAAAVLAHGNLDQSAQIARKFQIGRVAATLTAAGMTSDQLPLNGNLCGNFGVVVKKGATVVYKFVQKNVLYTKPLPVTKLAPSTVYTWQIQCALVADDGHAFIISGSGSFRTLK